MNVKFLDKNNIVISCSAGEVMLLTLKKNMFRSIKIKTFSIINDPDNLIIDIQLLKSNEIFNRLLQKQIKDKKLFAISSKYLVSLIQTFPSPMVLWNFP